MRTLRRCFQGVGHSVTDDFRYKIFALNFETITTGFLHVGSQSSLSFFSLTLKVARGQRLTKFEGLRLVDAQFSYFVENSLLLL
jgi:hypothetical protein